MALLPLPNPLGVFLVPKIFFVSGLFQPSLLAGSFPGLSTIGLETETLTLPLPVIRKKMFLAVEAFALALLSLHRFPSKGPDLKKNQRRKGRKSTEKKNQNSEEGRKIFSESSEENGGEEDPLLNRPFCGNSISPLAGDIKPDKIAVIGERMNIEPLKKAGEALKKK